MRVPLLLSVALLSWSAVANLVIGDQGYVARNLLLTVLLLAYGRWCGADARDLGVHPARVRTGAGWGLAAAAVVAVVMASAVVLAEVVPAIAMLLADERATDAADALIFVTLVRIPLGTALFEEVAFRGVLLGLLLRASTVGRAVALSSIVFGLWHIPPTGVALGINGVATTSASGAAAVSAAVVVTTLGGVGFAWLRVRSGSLLAPILAHWAVNAFSLLAATVARDVMG